MLAPSAPSFECFGNDSQKIHSHLNEDEIHLRYSIYYIFNLSNTH